MPATPATAPTPARQTATHFASFPPVQPHFPGDDNTQKNVNCALSVFTLCPLGIRGLPHSPTAASCRLPGDSVSLSPHFHLLAADNTRKTAKSALSVFTLAKLEIPASSVKRLLPSGAYRGSG